jgi:hypothetical protein
MKGVAFAAAIMLLGMAVGFGCATSGGAGGFAAPDQENDPLNRAIDVYRSPLPVLPAPPVEHRVPILDETREDD